MPAEFTRFRAVRRAWIIFALRAGGGIW